MKTVYFFIDSCENPEAKIPGILLTKYVTTKELQRLAIYNIANKTNLGSGYYKVVDFDGDEVTRFYFRRR